MKVRQPIACVLGDLDLVRPLGQAGIPCAVVDHRDPVIYSRFIRARFKCEEKREGETDPLVPALIRFAESQPEPPVLFYETDPMLLLVSRHRDELASRFRFVLADAELVEDLADKARFQALAERLELPVPRAFHLVPGIPVSDLDLRLPVVVKPTLRCLKVWKPLAGQSKAVLADTPERLEAIWAQVAPAGVEVVVQEYVPGPESRVESYHVYVDPAGEIAAEFTGRKLRTFPLERGWSSALIIAEAPDVADLGREVIRRLRLQGVAKLDFKRDPDGRLHLLEVNPRFNLWHHPGAAAGVNLPSLVYADLTGRPRPAVKKARPGVRWCSPGSDLRAARALNMPLYQWLGWALACETLSEVSWDDPTPLLLGILWPVIWSGAMRLLRRDSGGEQLPLSPAQAPLGVGPPEGT